MNTNLLKLTNVTKEFKSNEGVISALIDINLQINKGDFIAIIGPSGSGKSTLLNILGCLDYPTCGVYEIDGLNTSNLKNDEQALLRRDKIGFIFQNFNLISHLDAISNVLTPALYLETDLSNSVHEAVLLLKKLGLGKRMKYYPKQLSGGQQQRVGIARALINGKEIILADEPTGSLDEQSREEIIDILKKINEDGTTVIIITHDMNVAKVAKRIIKLNDGKIIDEILSDRGGLIEKSCCSKKNTEESEIFSSINILKKKNKSIYRSYIVKYLLQSTKIAYKAIKYYRTRVFLTVVGIAIGIVSFISTYSIGVSGREYVIQNISKLGTNTVSIYPGYDWGDINARNVITLKSADADALVKKDYVESVTPVVSQIRQIQFSKYTASALVSGVGKDFFMTRGMIISQGNGFNSYDVSHASQNVVIDSNTKQLFFPDESNVLGNIIFIDGLPCVITGVTDKDANSFNSSSNLNIWMPYTTASTKLFGVNYLDSILVRLKKGVSGDFAEGDITRTLILLHRDKDFFTYNFDAIVKTVKKTSQSLSTLLSSVGFVSLIVGAIGVMNVMFISVSERTNEIGTRIAMGAQKLDILIQFLLESVIICLIGGFIGIFLSFISVLLISLYITEWIFSFPLSLVIYSFLFSFLMGVLCGIVPSYRASRLTPVKALSQG